ncbi:YqaE/Pmp3 family membrane protein [Mesobacillus sp. S13]|uniref:YqaE/Pmp3 family membrane protein n=1 Tax=Mesobacillus sp. S13 TaxID=2880221 RepID=UPI001CF505D8|nr:YqaE/Pmp3 family membrane protein [Mesobacillus sp. S13]
MMYLLAVILPPVAVLLKGKPFQALLNLVLTIFFWLPGVIHAWIVINGANADKRMREQAKIIAQANKQQ